MPWRAWHGRSTRRSSSASCPIRIAPSETPLRRCAAGAETGRHGVRGTGSRGRVGAGGGLGLLVVRGPRHRRTAVLGIFEAARRADGALGGGGRHPDRRRRDPRRDSPAAAGSRRHRVMAAQCRARQPATAPARRVGGRRRGRTAAAVARRDVRPRGQPPSGEHVVVGGGPNPAARRYVPVPTDRRRYGQGAVRGDPGPAAAAVAPTEHRSRQRGCHSGRAGGCRPTVRGAAHRVLRHRLRRPLPP